MVNGSLEDWLHQHLEKRHLTLLQRLNIVINVASALDYLHFDCGRPLVHCDVKPSNILLDDDLVAHVRDFGLARILPDTSSTFSTRGMKGTIGYAAPEYGMDCELSTQGDVYSYGILLLEIFTGKSSTDDVLKDGLNLHNFERNAIPERVIEISDPALLHDQEIVLCNQGVMEISGSRAQGH